MDERNKYDTDKIDTEEVISRFPGSPIKEVSEDSFDGEEELEELLRGIEEREEDSEESESDLIDDVDFPDDIDFIDLPELDDEEDVEDLGENSEKENGDEPSADAGSEASEADAKKKDGEKMSAERIIARLIHPKKKTEEKAPSEEEVAQKKKQQKEHRIRLTKYRLIMLAILAVVVIGAGIGARYYQNHHQFSKVNVKWQKSISDGSFSGYAEFDSWIIKYTRDGAVAMNKSGEEVWNQAYDMSSPVVSTCGNYAVIADQGGYSMYICDKNGSQGIVTTTLQISKVRVASTGVTVAILEDNNSNYITFYDRSGNKLQIEVQTTLSGNGYPIDLDISPDGTLLMVSYVYLNEGVMENQVVFYNFAEEGQSIKDRLVAGFKEYETNMVARVKFMDNTHAVAFAQDRVCLYSLENTVKPQLITQIDVTSEIESVFYSDKNFGLVTDGENGKKVMTVYGTDGKCAAKTELEMEYSTVRLSGDMILFYKDTECAIYNLNGNLKYRGGLEGTIEQLLYLGNNRYLQIAPQSMMQIELK